MFGLVKSVAADEKWKAKDRGRRANAYRWFGRWAWPLAFGDLLFEKSGKAGVWDEGNEVKGDQVLLDERQCVEDLARLLDACGFEYENRSVMIPVEIEFADHV